MVFTSNVGSAEAMRMERSGFASVEHAVLRRVEQTMRPELIGRIDEKIVFARLTPDVQRQICTLEVARETARLRGLGYDFEVTREAIEFLVRKGYDPCLGARPMRRAVEQHLQDAVVRNLFATGVGHGKLAPDSEQCRLVILM